MVYFRSFFEKLVVLENLIKIIIKYCFFEPIWPIYKYMASRIYQGTLKTLGNAEPVPMERRKYLLG